MGLLDALIYGYRYVLDAANNLSPNRSRVRFLGSVTVVDNQLNDTTDVTVGAGSSTAGPTIDNSGTGAINAAPSQSAGIDAGGIRFTGAAPALAGVDPGSGTGRELSIVAFGGPLIIRNDNGGATASWRVVTGTGGDVTLPQGTTAILARDTQTSRWRLVAGQGGSSVTPTGTGFSHVTSGVLDLASKKVALDNAADVMNILAAANGGTGKGLADLSGQDAKALVVSAGGTGFTFAAIPPGTTVPSGSGFRKVVGGTEVSTAAAVDLASSTDRTGILPRANQQDQNLAGDVSGTTGSNVVNKINGVTVSGSPAGANLVLKTTSTISATWQTDATGGGGATAVGAASELQIRDPVTAGVFAAASGVTGGTNYLSVGVTGTPTYSGVRLANTYRLSGRSSGGTDISLCYMDSSDNFFLGSTTGTSSTSIDGSSGTTINFRIAGSTKFWIGGSINTSNNPLDFSGGSTTTGSILRLPASNASAVVAGTKPVISTDSTTVYFGSDNALSTQAASTWIAAGTHLSIGLGSTEAAAVFGTPTLWQNGTARVGNNQPWSSDGQVSIAITTSGKTLTAAEYSRQIWKFTGSSGGSGTITIPSVGNADLSYANRIRNTSTTDLAFTNGGSATVLIHAGRAGQIFSTPDGVFGFDWSTSATGSTVTGQA